MSTAEKLACEWEARHDVQARRRGPADPAALTHYVAHLRRDAALHAGHGAHGSPHDPAAHLHRVPRRDDPAHPAWLRGWLRWGEDEG